MQQALPFPPGRGASPARAPVTLLPGNSQPSSQMIWEATIDTGLTACQHALLARARSLLGNTLEIPDEPEVPQALEDSVGDVEFVPGQTMAG